MIENLLQVLISFLLAFILTLVVFRYVLPRLSTGGRGPYLSTNLKTSRIGLAKDKGIRIGDTGKADTYLRPSGKIVVGEKRLDAVTAGEFIEKGSVIEIIKIDGNRIIVTVKS